MFCSKFFSPPSLHISVIAVVMDQLFAFIGDVGGDLRDPVQDREQGKVDVAFEKIPQVEESLGQLGFLFQGRDTFSYLFVFKEKSCDHGLSVTGMCTNSEERGPFVLLRSGAGDFEERNF